jgi:Uncharacterized conserved protein (DUF2277)
MCRNIKTLHNFDPPVTDEEIQASALQFVRKLSGFTRPPRQTSELSIVRWTRWLSRHASCFMPWSRMLPREIGRSRLRRLEPARLSVSTMRAARIELPRKVP